MDFNVSPSGQAWTASTAAAVGAFGGGAVSRGLVTLIPVSGKTDADTLKKEKNIKQISRVVLMGLGLYGAAAIEGNDAVSAGVKGAAAGMFVFQLADLVRDLAADSPSIKSGAAATTKTQKFLAATLGLGCPGELRGNAAYAFLNGKHRKAPRLRMPAMAQPFDMADNFLQSALVAGENAAYGV